MANVLAHTSHPFGRHLLDVFGSPRIQETPVLPPGIEPQAKCEASGCLVEQLCGEIHLVEVSGSELPCFASKGDVVGVVHFAQVVEAASLPHGHTRCQNSCNCAAWTLILWHSSWV